MAHSQLRNFPQPFRARMQGCSREQRGKCHSPSRQVREQEDKDRERADMRNQEQQSPGHRGPGPQTLDGAGKTPTALGKQVSLAHCLSNGQVRGIKKSIS